ncbi:MAG: NACHT domain-containing protein [Frankiaceae bacterium]
MEIANAALYELPLSIDENIRNLDEIAEWLNDREVQVLVYELLTVRLLEQPEAEAERVKESVRLLFRTKFPEVPTSSTLSSQLAQAIDAACALTLDRLMVVDQGARFQIQAVAGISSAVATLRSIERHVAALTPEQRVPDETRERYLDTYVNYLLRHYSVITLPDLDTERKIPVDDIYVQPRITASEKDLASPLHLVTNYRRSVLLGSPGAGKSTTAGVIVYQLAKTRESIPFVVTLRSYVKDFDESRSIVQHLEASLNSRCQTPPPAGFVNQLLLSGRAIVVFDGLDELLETSKRRDVREAVESFCELYPAAPVLVTSRVVGYDQAPLSRTEFVRCELIDFDEAAIAKYVRRWFSVALPAERSSELEELVRAFLSESETVQDLRRSPLLLSLMCVLYRGLNYIPESRLNLYEECAKLLFKKWDRSRGINAPLELASELDNAIMHLAYWMFTEGQAETGVTEDSLIDQTVKYLVPDRYESESHARRAAEEFVKHCRQRAWVLADAGSTDSGERLYTFTHRTFLEYFCAFNLVRKVDTPEDVAEFLGSHLEASEWDMVGQLTVQISEKIKDQGATRVIARILDLAERRPVNSDSRRNLLDFAARCLQATLVAPSLIRRLTALAVEEHFDYRELHPDGEEIHQNTIVIPVFPLGQLLLCLPRGRKVVAQALEEYLWHPIRDESERVERRERALELAAYPEVVAYAAMTHLVDDALRRWWIEWRNIYLPKLFEGVQDIRYHDKVARLALEHGLMELDEYLQHLPFASLDERLLIRGSRGRTSMLRLLGGWGLGFLYPHVLRPEIAMRLLDQFANLVREDYFPLPPRNMLRQFRTEGRRCPVVLRNGALEGAIVLGCIEAESSRQARGATKITRHAQLVEIVKVLSPNLGLTEEANIEEVWRRVAMRPHISAMLSAWVSGSFAFFRALAQPEDDEGPA